MTKQTRDILRGYFTAGNIPTEQNFTELIDSMINFKDDGLEETPDGKLKFTGEEIEISKAVARGLGPKLLLNNKGGSVGAGGAIDFNGYDVGENAPSFRIQSLDNGSYSSHLAFLSKESGGNAHQLKERMRITADGKVGIGTDDPKIKLAVGANNTGMHLKGDGSLALMFDNLDLLNFNEEIVKVETPLFNVLGSSSFIGTIAIQTPEDSSTNRPVEVKRILERGGGGALEEENIPMLNIHTFSGFASLSSPNLGLNLNRVDRSKGPSNLSIGFSTPNSYEDNMLSALIMTRFTHELDFSTSDIVFFNTKDNFMMEERMIIKHDGKVGIGIKNPEYNLHISGDLKVDGKIITDDEEDVKKVLKIGDETAKDGTLNVHGNSVLEGNLNIVKGAENTGVLNVSNIKSPETLNLNQDNGQSVEIGKEGAEQNGNLIVHGNLGIGVEAPVEKLELEGLAKISQLHLASEDKVDSGKSFQVGNENIIKFCEDGEFQILTKKSGHFSRPVLGLHAHSDHALGFYSSGWKPLLEVEGGTGNTYIKGNVKIDGDSYIKLGNTQDGDPAAGKIAVNLNDAYAGLNIVGIGTETNTRKITLHTQGGLDIFGDTTIGTNELKSSILVKGNLTVEGSFINDGGLNFENGLEVGKSSTNEGNLVVHGNIGVGIEPSLKLAIGEAQTGINRNSTNELVLVTKNEERIQINELGRVGIGVSPDSEALLHIGGDVKIEGKIISTGEDSKDSLDSKQIFIGNAEKIEEVKSSLDDEAGILITPANNRANDNSHVVLKHESFDSGGHYFSIQALGSGINTYRGEKNIPNHLVLQEDSGNVGIGTSSPKAKLDVWGGIKMFGGDLEIQNGNIKMNQVSIIGSTIQGTGITESNPYEELHLNLQGEKDVIIGHNLVVKGEITSKGHVLLPIGTVVAYQGDYPPSGWLKCNGRKLSEYEYKKGEGEKKGGRYFKLFETLGSPKYKDQLSFHRGDYYKVNPPRRSLRNKWCLSMWINFENDLGYGRSPETERVFQMISAEGSFFMIKRYTYHLVIVGNHFEASFDVEKKIKSNEWHHIAVKIKEDTVSLYVNSEKLEKTLDENVIPNDINWIYGSLGYSRDINDNDDYFEGQTADFRLFQDYKYNGDKVNEDYVRKIMEDGQGFFLPNLNMNLINHFGDNPLHPEIASVRIPTSVNYISSSYIIKAE